ncbi:MAG: VCBS repeat-containing protein [Pirellulales bacterium]
MNRFLVSCIVASGMAVTLPPLRALAQSPLRDPEWTSPNRFRVRLHVDSGDRRRSNSPASVELDFQALLPRDRKFDEQTIEVVAIDDTGRAKVFNPGGPNVERSRVPHRLDTLFGSPKSTLNFVMRDHTCTEFAVYFDTIESRRGRPDRYRGLVGDGDYFRVGHQRREIGASHFDQFVDFDADGDLDLFQGGVEPYVYCYENAGGNRMVSRGRLANGGKLFTLPASRANRSWVTVAFFDIDDDGDLDFFPSFNDGPDAGRIIFYRNVTAARDGELTFERVGPLRTAAGVHLAGGAQAGGWFPTVTFVRNWDGDGSGRLDALVGSNNRCWLYRGSGSHADGSPRFADAIAVQAGGKENTLVNPRFDYADIDGDGDLDLFAGTQPGPIWQFENTGTRTRPILAAGRIIALGGKYLIGDAHSGVKIADFDSDGLLDLVVGRFWERTVLNDSEAERDFGGFFRNVGSRKVPSFVRRRQDGPFTEQFQLCDAVRQNCIRAVDWDQDGHMDLLAGDTDGFIWYFRNEATGPFSLFANGQKVRAGDEPLNVTQSGGHARPDVCDWNNDGHLDLLVADGSGTLTLFKGISRQSIPAFNAGEKILANGKPIQHGARASVLVCDWDNDGRKDVVFADANGYYWHRNVGADANPILNDPKPITFSGKTTNYVRPNLGSYVDWDGDGKRDFIACEFENNVRWYRNTGSGARDEEPQFADPEGVVVLQASSPQMISGVHAVDWNGDGDIDLLTGQGHGGSGLRFYERDWIEDELRDAHPQVTVGGVERKPSADR